MEMKHLKPFFWNILSFHCIGKDLYSFFFVNQIIIFSYSHAREYLPTNSRKKKHIKNLWQIFSVICQFAELSVEYTTGTWIAPLNVPTI